MQTLPSAVEQQRNGSQQSASFTHGFPSVLQQNVWMPALSELVRQRRSPQHLCLPTWQGSWRFLQRFFRRFRFPLLARFAACHAKQSERRGGEPSRRPAEAATCPEVKSRSIHDEAPLPRSKRSGLLRAFLQRGDARRELRVLLAHLLDLGEQPLDGRQRHPLAVDQVDVAVVCTHAERAVKSCAMGPMWRIEASSLV